MTLFESVTDSYSEEQLTFLAEHLERSNAAFGVRTPVTG